MGLRWGDTGGGQRRQAGEGRRRSSDLWNAGAAGALVGGLLIGALVWASDDDPDSPPAPVDAEIQAAMVVNTAVIEMRGYGPDGEPGTFLYDCEQADQPVADVDPTLVCTQREVEG